MNRLSTRPFQLKKGRMRRELKAAGDLQPKAINQGNSASLQHFKSKFGVWPLRMVNICWITSKVLFNYGSALMLPIYHISYNCVLSEKLTELVDFQILTYAHFCFRKNIYIYIFYIFFCMCNVHTLRSQQFREKYAPKNVLPYFFTQTLISKVLIISRNNPGKNYLIVIQCCCCITIFHY